MNLPERKVRMLKMNLLWTPPVRDLVERDLDHFRFGVVDPRDPAVVEPDMGVGCCWHTSSGGTLSRRHGGFNGRKQRLRRETTMTLKWISQRLEMDA